MREAHIRREIVPLAITPSVGEEDFGQKMLYGYSIPLYEPCMMIREMYEAITVLQFSILNQADKVSEIIKELRDPYLCLNFLACINGNR